VPCTSGERAFHMVTVKDDLVTCDCPARAICKHVLSSVGRPVAQFAMQARWSEDLETLREVVRFYSEGLRWLPLPLREIARAEYQAARERLSASRAIAA
jgi:hypothetical protein